MPTFPRGFATYQANLRNAQLLARLAREAGGNVAEERARLTTPTPVDDIALRGLPCVGSRAGGTILGTRPEAALLAKERRQRGQ